MRLGCWLERGGGGWKERWGGKRGREGKSGETECGVRKLSSGRGGLGRQLRYSAVR